MRDLADFVVRCLEQKTNGVFNATSAPGELTMGELLESCKRVSGSDATFTWADTALLEKKEVAAWSDMPVWVPLDGEDAGHPFIDVSRALEGGHGVPADQRDGARHARLVGHRAAGAEGRADEGRDHG